MSVLKTVFLAFVIIPTAFAQTTRNGTCYPDLPLRPAQFDPSDGLNSGIPGFQVREIPVSLNTSKPSLPTPENFAVNDGGLWLKEAPINEVFQFLAGREEVGNSTYQTYPYNNTGPTVEVRPVSSSQSPPKKRNVFPACLST